MEKLSTRTKPSRRNTAPFISISPYNTSKIHRIFRKIGFSNATKITDTLQGSIWRVQKMASKEGEGGATQFVIKITNKCLHKYSLGIVGHSTYSVSEDILLEQSILKYLTQQHQCPKSIVKYHRFCKTSTDYFLIMEDGGSCLFDFVREAHELIRGKKLAMSEWRKVVKILYKQMAECIYFMHSRNVVHFDLSLENVLINDIKIEVVENVKTKKCKLKFVTRDIQIKLCDFGLAELFTKEECQSNKNTGKKQYKSPELLSNKKQFDAKANDIWCFGICLFMIATGCPPWDVADKSDKTFNYVMKYSVGDLLTYWKIIDDIDEGLVDLLDSIFQYQQERVSIYDIKHHIYGS